MCFWIAFPYSLCTVTTTQTKLTITLALLWVLQVCFTGKYIGAIFLKPFWSFYMETKNFQNVCFSARRNFLISEQFLHGVLSWSDSPWLALISSYHWILFAFEDLTFVRSRAVLRSVSKKRIPGAVTVILPLTWTPYSGLFPSHSSQLNCLWADSVFLKCPRVKSHAWSCHFVLALIQHSTTLLIFISPAYFWCENIAIFLKTLPQGIWLRHVWVSWMRRELLWGRKSTQKRGSHEC